MSSPSSSSDYERQHELLRQKQQHEQQIQWANFINSYPLNLLFPAKVSGAKKSAGKNESKPVKTNEDLINARLLENGILFEDLQNFTQLQPGIARFVDNLNRTGCFNSVKIELDVSPPTAPTEENGDTETPNDATATSAEQNDANTATHQLNVILDEKKWYSLYIGGGFKQEGMEQAANNLINGNSNTGGGTGFGLGDGILGRLPKAQFETSTTLLNLTGKLDTSTFRYTVDQTSTSSIALSHERPLYTWFNHSTNADAENGDGGLGNIILALPRGSQYSLGIKGMIDTIDYEYTRSYKEYQRFVGFHLDNIGGLTLSNNAGDVAPTPDIANNDHWCYWGVDWTLALRDVVPRRHSKLPYACDSSPEIVALSGPSLIHSLTYQLRTNGSFTDNRYQPTSGYDYHTKLQLAGPPGDVGFIKAQGGCSIHLPLLSETPSDNPVVANNGGNEETMQSDTINWLALHGNFNAGMLQPFSFSGICRPPTISDRFFVGGPLQLRGFLPAGIGPRAKTGGSTSPGGDALGGTLYYTVTAAASMAVPAPLVDYGAMRLFCFCNAGTVVGGGIGGTNLWKNGGQLQGIPLAAIANSSRVSTGIGLSMGTQMGRLEATYAWPLRYGPRDARSNFQFGIGFNFG